MSNWVGSLPLTREKSDSDPKKRSQKHPERRPNTGYHKKNEVFKPAKAEEKTPPPVRRNEGKGEKAGSKSPRRQEAQSPPKERSPSAVKKIEKPSREVSKTQPSPLREVPKEIPKAFGSPSARGFSSLMTAEECDGVYQMCQRRSQVSEEPNVVQKVVLKIVPKREEIHPPPPPPPPSPSPPLPSRSPTPPRPSPPPTPQRKPKMKNEQQVLSPGSPKRRTLIITETIHITKGDKKEEIVTADFDIEPLEMRNEDIRLKKHADTTIRNLNLFRISHVPRSEGEKDYKLEKFAKDVEEQNKLAAAEYAFEDEPLDGDVDPYNIPKAPGSAHKLKKHQNFGKSIDVSTLKKSDDE